MRQQRHWRKAAFITELQRASSVRTNGARYRSSHTVPANHLWEKHFDRTMWATWLLRVFAEGPHFCCPLHRGSANPLGAAGAQAGLGPIPCRRNDCSSPARDPFLRLLLKPSPTQLKVRKPWSHRLIVGVWFGVFCLVVFLNKQYHGIQANLVYRLLNLGGAWKTN